MSQKFVPLIACGITFDRNYTSAWNFVKTFIALLSTYLRKVNIQHALLCLISRSEAVAAWSGIKSHVAWRGERDFLPGLFEPSFQILHGFRSWVFIDDFIHYAPRFSTGLISGEFGGQHIFSIKCDRFFLGTMPGWPWLRVLAPRLGRTSCTWRLELHNFCLYGCFIHVYTVKDRLLICCWCSNRQSKSVLGVKDVSQ